MSQPCLLLINPGPFRKRPLLEAFSRLPVTLYVLAAPEQRWVEELVVPERVAFCNVMDGTTVVRMAVEFSTCFDGAGTYYEPSVLSAAYACKQMGLRGPSLEAVKCSSISKVNMRLALQRSGIATPQFAYFSDIQELSARAEEIGYPCVLKPASGADSQSVRKIESRRDAFAIIKQGADLEHFRKTAYWIDHDARWLVEEYLEGPLLAVDGYIRDGQITYIGTAEMELGAEPYFNIEVNWIPPRLSESAVDAARSETACIVTAIGLDNAAFHAEFRLTALGPKLVEIAARLAGGVMPQGYQQSYGIDPAGILAELWLGQPLEQPPPFERPRHVLQKGVFPKEPGVLKAIYNIEAARRRPEVFEFSQVSRIGDPLLVYPDASVPVYYYGMVADSHKDLLSASRALEASIIWNTVHGA